MNSKIITVAPIHDSFENLFNELKEVRPLPCFNLVTMQFISALSKTLMSPKSKAYPDVVALGFWLRNISQRERAGLIDESQSIRKPLGVVAHFTPANVDTMFMYSWVCGLLMGNTNIIRLASLSTPSQLFLLEQLNMLLAQPEFTDIKRRNCFIQYDKNSHWSATISLHSDARVMWGGDDSVQSIRQLPTKPRTREVSFADRYSVTLLKWSENDKNQGKMAALFWQDIKLYNQQACSSPRVVFCCGSDANIGAFTRDVADIAAQDMQLSLQTRNEQLVTAQAIVSECGGKYWFNGTLCFVQPEHFDITALQYHNGFNVIVVVPIDTLTDINDLIDEKAQTMTYFGASRAEMLQFATQLPIAALDRLVPLGQALDFEPIWDGYNLLEMLSRHVSIK